ESLALLATYACLRVLELSAERGAVGRADAVEHALRGAPLRIVAAQPVRHVEWWKRVERKCVELGVSGRARRNRTHGMRVTVDGADARDVGDERRVGGRLAVGRRGSCCEHQQGESGPGIATHRENSGSICAEDYVECRQVSLLVHRAGRFADADL